MAKRYVYLVEDDPGLRSLVARVLSGLPRVEVKSYEAAENALTDFESFRPLVVITDLGLPGMSGVEFIARTRQWFPRVSVVVTTGSRARFQAQLRGFDGVEVWEKPLEILALRDRVNALVAPGNEERSRGFVPFSVSDYLQLASLGDQNLILRMKFGDGRQASIMIVGGKIWDCRLGMLRGIEALSRALEHEAEGIDFEPLARQPGERRIEGSTSQILLELAVTSDAAQRPPGDELVP